MRSVVWMGLVGAGCAARHPDCHPMPAGRVAPAGYEVRSADGLCLQGSLWEPAGEPRAVVVALHGIRDHGGRYEALGKALSAEGMLVVAQDHRGHGRSGGKRQRFDSIEELVDGAALAVGKGRELAPGVPVFLYGHSMGGLTAVQYGLRRPSEVAGIVLSGAALRLPDEVKPSQIRAAKLAGAITPGLRAQEVDDTVFVRTAEGKADLAADPLVDHFNLPAASARAAVLGIEYAKEHAGELSVPLLAMHGLGDVATNPEGSRELVERASSTDKTLKLFEGVSHDLLHEPEAGAVIAEVVGWIEARLPAVEEVRASPEQASMDQ